MLTPESQAQVSGISVSPGTHISADNPKAPYAETFMAINPRNPNNLIAGSFVVEKGDVYSVVYASMDGSKTWKRSRTTTSDNAIFKGGDPVVYFDASGTPFFGALQGTPVGYLLSRSNDGGLTWEPPVTIPGGTYDREYAAFDNSGGRFNGRMYTGGTIDVTEASGKRHNALDILSSADGGRTFSPGRVLTGDWNGEDIFVMSDLLVTPDGKLVAPYSTFGPPPHGGPDAIYSGHLMTKVSEDGGITFSPAQTGPTHSSGAGFRAIKNSGAPRAAIDLSNGPYRGRIYFAWTDLEGKKYVAKVAYSADLGKTWSSPVVVNDNTNDGEPANPAIAVNKDGVVGVVFNDRRDDPKNSCYRLYFAASVDGGETFLPNVKASEGATCPLDPGNWAVAAFSFLDLPLDLSKEKRRPAISFTGVPERWPNGGDTQGFVAGPDGVFHSAWINGESGVMQLWSKDFTVNTRTLLKAAPSREDLSRQLTLDVSDPILDFDAHTVSVKVRIENPLAVSVEGPFSVALDDVISVLKDFHVVNADNGLGAKGAVWNFTGTTSLQSKQKTEEKIFKWTFTGGPPEEPDEPLRAHFLILGRTQH
jgi:hypothetical protein